MNADEERTTQPEEKIMNATKNATTVKLSGGDLGPEIMYVRCDLTQASAPIHVDYHNDGVEEWCGSQFQCADARHTVVGLIERGKFLAAYAVEVNPDDFDCD